MPTTRGASAASDVYKRQVRDRELYDLKAIPALYLLDRDKRVMVKDAVDVGLIEWAIDHDDRKN